MSLFLSKYKSYRKLYKDKNMAALYLFSVDNPDYFFRVQRAFAELGSIKDLGFYFSMLPKLDKEPMLKMIEFFRASDPEFIAEYKNAYPVFTVKKIHVTAPAALVDFAMEVLFAMQGVMAMAIMRDIAMTYGGLDFAFDIMREPGAGYSNDQGKVINTLKFKLGQEQEIIMSMLKMENGQAEVSPQALRKRVNDAYAKAESLGEIHGEDSAECKDAVFYANTLGKAYNVTVQSK